MRLSFTILLSLTSFLIFSQNSGKEENIKIMFYNVENLFDTHATNENDEEFTPTGNRHWTQKKLEQKISNIAKVITAAGKWQSPAIIGLCEIENLYVLEKLCQHPLLRKSKYRIIHKESPDHRGIDVAMLYRKDIFYPTSYAAIPITNEQQDTLATREILYVSGCFLPNEQFHFFVNHWPSRYGGLLETVHNRELAAKCLKHKIDQIETQSPGAKIICMGDFNDQPNDESIKTTLGASDSKEENASSHLINLSSTMQTRNTGTIKYQQEWTIFDQFIVSRNIINSVHASIYSAPFLLEPDQKYAGVKPFRTYAGYRYNGGFSDHLPILLELIP